jgi:ketosteroid isomerase-like protein
VTGWNQHDTAAFAGLLADGFTFEDVVAPESFRTREQVQAYSAAWFEAFPDMHTRTTRRVVSDDEAAREIESTGTITGPIHASDKEIQTTGNSVIRFWTYFGPVRDGRIVPFRAHPDVASVVGQFGLMPGM